MARNRRIEWDEKAGVLPNARRELPRLVAAYFSRVREVLAEDGSPRKLHRLRLASKRLRYTLELFRPCYPAGLEERLDALKKLQDWLGEVNDAVASARLLRGVAEAPSEGTQVSRRPGGSSRPRSSPGIGKKPSMPPAGRPGGRISWRIEPLAK